MCKKNKYQKEISCLEKEIEILNEKVNKYKSHTKILTSYKQKYEEDLVLKMNPFEMNDDDRYVAYLEYDSEDRYEILEGYCSAVFCLIENIICHYGTEDELIYPIVFSARHSIEIGLKIIYEMIGKIKKIKSGKSVEYMAMHDLRVIENKLCEAAKIDNRIKEKFDDLKPYLSDYYFDKDEDIFRYKVGKGGQNLIKENKITRISIDVFCCKYYYLQNKLKEFYFLVEELINEYKLKTYTSRFSRKEIFDLAKDLKGFDKSDRSKKIEIKDLLEEKYSVKTNQIDQAIKMIRKNPETSIYLGQEQMIGNIESSEIEAYIDIVYEREIKNRKIINRRKAGEFSIEEIIMKNNKTNSVLKKNLSKIASSSILLLRVFMLFGKGDIKYSEMVESNFEELKKRADSDEFLVKDLIRKITNYSSCGYIMEGMHKYGQFTYEKILLENLKKYNIKRSEIIQGWVDIEDL